MKKMLVGFVVCVLLLGCVGCSGGKKIDMQGTGTGIDAEKDTPQEEPAENQDNNLEEQVNAAEETDDESCFNDCEKANLELLLSLGEEAETKVEDSGMSNSALLEDVVFLNDIPLMYRNGVPVTENVVFSSYEQQEAEDVIYAFFIQFDHYNDGSSHMPSDYPCEVEGETYEEYHASRYQYEARKAVEIAKDAGLMVLPDYPFCCYNQNGLLMGYGYMDRLGLGLCAVAGTLEDVNKIFDNTPPVDGWYCCLWPAPRPDLLDIMEEAGWEHEDNSMTASEWFRANYELLKPLLGDENQVTMRVQIESPTIMEP